MEKKKLKLSISGSSKKTFSSIEQAKTQSKNTVVIEKKSSKFPGKSQFSRQNINHDKSRSNPNFSQKNLILLNPPFLHTQILKKENWQSKELQED